MTSTRDLVSVITPAFNSEKTIGETIQSVLNQSYDNWEMIIVDDCSTDKTVEIVNMYAKIDSRISLIKLEENSGSAVARNTAIRCAKGRYVALLDSDDLWKPEKIERQLQFMKANNLSFSFTAYDIFRNSSDRRRKIFDVPKQINYRQYMSNSIIGCLTVMIDKNQIRDFHMEEGYLEDVLTWMFYLHKGIVAYGLNENLASYRLSDKSKSSQKIKNAWRYYLCLKQQKDINWVQRCWYQLGYVFHASKKRIFSKRTM